MAFLPRILAVPAVQILRLPTKNIGILRMTYWGSFYTVSMPLAEDGGSSKIELSVQVYPVRRFSNPDFLSAISWADVGIKPLTVNKKMARCRAMLRRGSPPITK
jgi:hypothetical protein